MTDDDLYQALFDADQGVVQALELLDVDQVGARSALVCAQAALRVYVKALVDHQLADAQLQGGAVVH